jgi:transposase InsO family protein
MSAWVWCARLVALVAFVAASLSSRQALALENLALRQQLAVLRRQTPRPKLGLGDKLFWVALSRVWPRWREALCLVQPATVVAWHRAGFRLFWRWRSRGGRPHMGAQVEALVRRLAADNPLWGAPRIHGEVLKLGFRLAQSTVAALLRKVRGPRPRKPASPTWRTFLKTHLFQAAAIDFFVIPTVTFRLLYGLVILTHGRRRLHHVAVTAHPTAAWTSQQLKEAFPFDSAPRFLHRDRDGIYGDTVPAAMKVMGIEEVVSAPRSPWQNPYCERIIGTLRREVFDHVIVLNEAHALRLLKEYAAYYNGSRTHLGLEKDSPESRAIERESAGPVQSEEVLGGLHHRYFRRAA